MIRIHIGAAQCRRITSMLLSVINYIVKEPMATQK